MCTHVTHAPLVDISRDGVQITDSEACMLTWRSRNLLIQFSHEAGLRKERSPEAFRSLQRATHDFFQHDLHAWEQASDSESAR